ncbi:hypothetical protein ACLIA0_12750 [Bacillaceae bacterium W0354]
MGQEVLIQQNVNKQYEIETIYHPVDMTTDPFNKLLYLRDGTLVPFPEMKREVYLNGEMMSSYNEFMNKVDVSNENQMTRVISFYDTEVSVVDTFTGTKDYDAREKSNVELFIDKKNYAEPVQLEIRPAFLDNNRYHGYLGMLKLTNNSTNEEELVIIQRLFGEPFSTEEKDFKWKVIFINKEGEVKTDIFTRDEIDSPAYRKDLINKATVSPFALGYKSNLLHSYPSLFYPILYPFGSMGLGIIFLVLGIVVRKRKGIEAQ